MLLGEGELKYYFLGVVFINGMFKFIFMFLWIENKYDNLYLFYIGFGLGLFFF